MSTENEKMSNWEVKTGNHESHRIEDREVCGRQVPGSVRGEYVFQIWTRRSRGLVITNS